jgi:hypothetical protein
MLWWVGKGALAPCPPFLALVGTREMRLCPPTSAKPRFDRLNLIASI